LVMGQDYSSAEPDHGQFAKTRWSTVLEAVQSRAHAEKRGGRAELIRLDWQDAEKRLIFEPEDRLTPKTLYDAQWRCCFCAAPQSALSKNKTRWEKPRPFAH